MRIAPDIDLDDDDLRALCRKYAVRQLSLFGSVLTDAPGPECDIDLLVEFEPDARVGLWELRALRHALSERLGRPVDLVPKRGLKPIIRDQLLRQARAIYAA